MIQFFCFGCLQSHQGGVVTAWVVLLTVIVGMNLQHCKIDLQLWGYVGHAPFSPATLQLQVDASDQVSSTSQKAPEVGVNMALRAWNRHCMLCWFQKLTTMSSEQQLCGQDTTKIEASLFTMDVVQHT